MTDPVRAAALSLAWTLVGCHRVAPVIEPEPSPVPGPIAEVDQKGALAIVPVPQLTPVSTIDWSFEPEGRWFATIEFGDCSIFDIASGRLVHSHPMDNYEAEPPCLEWGVAETLYSIPTSADERLELDTTTDLTIVDVDSGKPVRTIPCPDCPMLSDITWSRTGHQVAAVWEDPPRVAVWDADTGKQLWNEDIPVRGEIEQLALGWTAGGAMVMWSELGFPVECEEYEYDCEWDDDLQMSVRQSAARQALVLGASKVEIPLGEDVLDVFDVEFDPTFRWAFWQRVIGDPREGHSVELNFVALAGQPGGGSWTVRDSEDEYEPELVTREGEWRTDGLIHWASSVLVEGHDGDSGSLGWETIIASPPLGRRAGTVNDELDWGAEVYVYVHGFAGEALRMSGEVCQEAGCTPAGVVSPPDCELMDVASGHATELFDCGGKLFMRNGGKLKRLPHDPSSLEWWWSRGGALVLDDAAMFSVLDAASGVGSVQRTDVTAAWDGRLGLELERMAVATDRGLEILDLAAGKVIAKFPDTFPHDVAFSPTGDRVAMLGEDQIRVFSLPGGESLKSWPCSDVELAFRQDGLAIFVGDTAHDGLLGAYDVATGREIDISVVQALNDSGYVSMDPSWRWMMHDETGELTRMLDGLTLAWLEDGGAWLTSTGVFQGSGPGPEVAYRVGGDATTVPEFSAAQLTKWLQRDDLVELFLAGKPIPTPSITAGELAGVRAAMEAEKQ